MRTWRLTDGGTWHIKGFQCKNKNGESLTRLSSTSLPARGQLCPVCLDHYRTVVAVPEPQTERWPHGKPVEGNNAAFSPTPVGELTPGQQRGRRRAVRQEMEQEERCARMPRMPSAGSPGLGKRR